jgi:hypothetical protein
VVAVGVHLDHVQIEGMDAGAIGANKAPGLNSVYPGPEAAQATWAAMQAFTANGGNAVMTLPATPLNCAGAPSKMSFMLRDRPLKGLETGIRNGGRKFVPQEQGHGQIAFAVQHQGEHRRAGWPPRVRPCSSCAGAR